MSNHLFDAFVDFNKDLSRPFVETVDGSVLSYKHVFDFAAQIANVLVALSVSPGDRVAVQVEKSAEALMLYLACVQAGAVYLPLNTAYTPREVEYFLGDAQPALVVCDPAALEGLSPITHAMQVQVVTLDSAGDGSLIDMASSAPSVFAPVPREPDDLAAILYTSGTTGRSKGAMLTHHNLLSNALSLCKHWQFTRDDRLIHGLPIFHTHGLFVATNTVLLSGSSMFLLPGFDPDRILSLMPRATVMMGVPTHYVRLLQNPALTPQLAAGMRLFVSGSAPLLVDTHKTFEERTGHVILERYGMTETNMITSNPYDGRRIAGTVGLPLPGVEVRIAPSDDKGEDGQPEIGMIEVRGPNVFSGYWHMPEKAKQEFQPDGFFITGDLGHIDEQGYVTIVGRGKDLVISGGFNVYPREVEDEIDLIKGVVESAVVGIPHPDFGEGVTAFVVRESEDAVSDSAIAAVLKSRLANFKRPKKIMFVDRLPRNTMGKVQKNFLREQFARIYLSTAE